MKIGISIISYNRPKCTLLCAQSIIKTLEKMYEYKLICCNDDDNINEFLPLKDWGFDIIYHPNFGVSINKSIALYHLKDCDHFFLIEEDIELVKEGWISLYLNSHQAKNAGIIDILPQVTVEDEKNILLTEQIGNMKFIYTNIHTAQIMSITKETFEKVGYLNPIFYKYGFEHTEYTERCRLINLYPKKWFFMASNTYEYVKLQNSPRSITENEIIKCISKNHSIFYSRLKELKENNNVFIGVDKIQQYIQTAKII